MSLKKRFILSYFLISSLVLIVLLFSAFGIIYFRFSKLENHQATQQIDRLQDYLIKEVGVLTTLSSDYAYWDDTYNYIQQPNQEYLDENVTQENFGNVYKLDFVMFINNNNQVIHWWENQHTFKNKLYGESTDQIPDYLLPAIDKAMASIHGVEGFVNSPSGPLLLTIRPILPTHQANFRKGLFIAGKQLNKEKLEEISDVLKNPISFVSLDSQSYNSIAANVSKNTPVTFEKNRKTITTYSPLKDIQEQSIGFLSLQAKRDIYNEALYVFHLFVAMATAIHLFSASLVAGFSNHLFSNILRRIELLRKNAQAVIESNFEQTPVLFSLEKSHDELGQLAITLHTLQDKALAVNHNLHKLVQDKTDELASKLAREEKTTIAMTHLLARAKRANTELSQKEQELEKANAKLIKLDKLKNEFLSNVNHELRTPLTSIRMYNQLIYEEDLGPVNPEQKSALKEILSAADHLLQIIKDILDLKKLEEGKYVFAIAPQSIEEIIADVKVNMKALIEHSKTPVTFKVVKSLPPLLCDKIKIVEVVQNLLSNAIKYNRNNHPIRITVSPVQHKNKKACQIQVIDQGIGIKAADQKHLFDKFYRAEAVLTQTTEGTGLGLNIAKHIVEAHHGTITIDSTYKKGTTITVILPFIKGE